MFRNIFGWVSLLIFQSVVVSTPAAEAPRVRLAIGGFSKPGDPVWNAEQNEKICALLTAALSGQNHFDLIERSEIKRALDETTLSQWTASNANRLGQLLRADWLLVGSFVKKHEGQSLAARLVDAQSGTVRDLICLPYLEKEPDRVAAELARFVGASSEQPALARRVYLGLGTLEDQGVQDRAINAKAELRRALEEAFRGTHVAIVEREMVNPLLRELRLGLSGLSANGPKTESGEPAFVLIDGIYQGFQDDKFKINLLLRLRRLGENEQKLSFTELPGEPLFSKVVAALRQAIDQPSASPGGTRADEAQWQIEQGKERARLPNQLFGATLGGYLFRDNNPRRRQNILEAIDAFESALFLQPDHAEAKLFLAACLLEEEEKFNRESEARDYLQEVINSTTNHTLVHDAKRKLAWSYDNADKQRAFDLFRQFAAEAPTVQEHFFFIGEAAFRARFLRKANTLPVAAHRQLLQEALRVQLESIEENVKAAGAEREFLQGYSPQAIRNTFRLAEEIYPFDLKSTAGFLDETLAPLLVEHPKLALPVWSTYLSWQAQGNLESVDAVAPQVLQLLESYQQQPESVLWPKLVKRAFIQDLCDWAHHSKHPTIKKVSDLAHAIMGRGLPLKLVAVTNGINQAFIGTNLPPRPPGAPPLVFAHRPAPFSLNTPVFRGVHNLRVIPDGSNLWMVNGWMPELYDKASGTVTELDWPVEIERVVTSIALASDRVWFGTDGNGLIEWDRTTRGCRIYREAQGLTMDHIQALLLSGDRLWIGYGKRMGGGGVGFLEIKTGRFVGMSSALLTNAFKVEMPASQTVIDGAPKKRVVGFAQPIANELYVLSDESGLLRYQVAEDKWTTLGSSIKERSTFSALASNGRYMAHAARYCWDGLRLHDLPACQERPVIGVAQYLKPSAGPNKRNPWILSLALDDEKLWVGAEGFLALIDIPSSQVEKLCDLEDSEEQVRSIVVDGDKLWVTVNERLYRLPRKTLLGPSQLQALR